MWMDGRFPWLAAATVAGEPSVDELLRLREMAGFDADVTPEPACDWCLDTGTAQVEVFDGDGPIVVDVDCSCNWEHAEDAA